MGREKKTELRNGFDSIHRRARNYAPILIHGYDYLTASGKKAMYDGFTPHGPWILPRCETAASLIRTCKPQFSAY